MAEETLQPQAPPGNAKETIYTVGSLSYNGKQLFFLFIWLLMGGFCLSFIGSCGTLFTMSLNSVGAKDWLIALIIGTIPAVLNMIVCPIVSFRSDRTRSKLGRRIPYIIVSVPFISIAILGVAWAHLFVPSVAALLGIPVQTLALVLCAFFIVAYNFFVMFVGSVYYYLYADVVPESWIGKFNACFTLIGTGAGAAFSFFLLPYFDKYGPGVYTIMALMIITGFMLMCWKVKEGTYPEIEETYSPLKATFVYLKECFASDSFYLWFFTTTAMNDVSVVCRNTFNILFAKQELGLTSGEFGYITGATAAVGLIMTLPLGVLIDKYRAIRIYVTGMILVIIANIYGYFFCQDALGFSIVSFGLALVYCIQNTANLPLFIELLPKDRYGQFCSAQAIFRSIIMVGATAISGLYIYIFGYRYMFVWDAVFTTIALGALVMVWKGWRKNGGPDEYVAPNPPVSDLRLANFKYAAMFLFLLGIAILCTCYYVTKVTAEDIDLRSEFPTGQPQNGEFSVAIFGDSDVGAAPITEAAIHLSSQKIPFALFVGDFTSADLNDMAFRQSKKELRDAMSLPFFATPGSVDLIKGASDRFEASFGPGEHSFIYGDVLFVAIDTAKQAFSEEQAEELQKLLAEKRNLAKYCVIYTHTPPAYPENIDWSEEALELRKAAAEEQAAEDAKAETEEELLAIEKRKAEEKALLDAMVLPKEDADRLYNAIKDFNVTLIASGRIQNPGSGKFHGIDFLTTPAFSKERYTLEKRKYGYTLVSFPPAGDEPFWQTIEVPETAKQKSVLYILTAFFPVFFWSGIVFTAIGLVVLLLILREHRKSCKA